MASCASPVMPLRVHAGAQLHFDIRHALFGALEAHGAAQFFGLAAGESGRDHRHAQQLLLKQRHAQRALQHRLERGVQAIRLFPPLPPVQIRMHHLAHDRAGPDDRHLHHDVVKPLAASCAASEDICARLSTWNMPTVSAFCSASKTAGSSCGRCARSTASP